MSRSGSRRRILYRKLGGFRPFGHFRRLPVRDKFGVVFFGHSALSFGIGPEGSFYYKIDHFVTHPHTNCHAHRASKIIFSTLVSFVHFSKNKVATLRKALVMQFAVVTRFANTLCKIR